MENVWFTTEDNRSGPAATPNAASVERDVAKLFERFRLDLEQMLVAAPGNKVRVRTSRSIQAGRPLGLE